MKHIYFFFSVLVGFSSMAQNAELLDEKGGFRSFTLHKELSAVQEKMEFLKVFDHKHAKLFKVEEPVVVDGFSGIVELVFYKYKIAEITIFFEKTSMEDYEEMKRSLTRQFGPFEDHSKSESKPDHLAEDDYTITWKGKKVGLQLIYDVSHKVTEMIYWGLEETSIKIKAEFKNSNQ
ncbi:MAG TPA: hypothetical protein VL728_15775 [Cyclobacteriaceae bacterium]|nr:hypothetical protein [Cyclobacteriaceae bacterium]